MTLKVGYIVSGGGFVLRELFQRDPTLISFVLADRPCGALHFAEIKNIPCYESTYESGLVIPVESRPDVDVWVTLYDRLLTASMIEYFCRPKYYITTKNREYHPLMINLHPALLPSFRGLHAVRQALDAGVTFTGSTVHFVDAGMDTGKIISQSPWPVTPGISEVALAEEVLRDGARLLARTLQEGLWLFI
jgi:phosphoribosylglycinamide formyltransferase-1